jgi:predicted ATPase
LWLLGYPTQALQKNTEALDFARQLNHDYSVSYVLFYTVMLHCCRREQYAAQEQAEELIVFSQDRQFKYRLAQGRLLNAWIPTPYRAGEADIEHIQQYLAEIQGYGTEVYRPYYLLLLAEAYRRLEQPREGLAMVDQALAVIEKTEERFYEAELHRLKGELLQQTGKNPRRIDKAAEQCFQQALAVSRGQQAKSLELRAAMSLSRLWQRKGKHVQAHQLLEGVYSWFTEGFDTADLQDAEALLAELT